MKKISLVMTEEAGGYQVAVLDENGSTEFDTRELSNHDKFMLTAMVKASDAVSEFMHEVQEFNRVMNHGTPEEQQALIEHAKREGYAVAEGETIIARPEEDDDGDVPPMFH